MRETKIYNLTGIPIYESYTDISDELYTHLKNEDWFKSEKIWHADYECTSFQRNLLLEEPYTDLGKVALTHCESYLRDHIKFNVPAECEFRIVDSWALKNGSITFHQHNYSFLSGVIYFEKSDQFAIFQNQVIRDFWLPFHWGSTNERTEYNTTVQTINPEYGKIIIFPSKLVHAVPAFPDTPDRHCIAFTVFPVGTISDHPTSRCKTPK